jgi:hypothetical protein
MYIYIYIYIYIYTYIYIHIYIYIRGPAQMARAQEISVTEKDSLLYTNATAIVGISLHDLYTSPYVSIRQHTSAYVNIRQHRRG